ncbi:NADH:ubiquinone oxidoreductase subunit M [Desulfocarbo indianensis]|nr:NADH:ubiquinone oxidoreductase subunit M [Desulfocarbo indianensis]
MLSAQLPVLSLLIFFPLAGCVALFWLGDEKKVRVFTLAVSLVELALALPLLGFRLGEAGFQFVEHAPWVASWGLAYYLGVDGISVLMVALTVAILPLCVLCSWSYIASRVREFHFCLLFMTSACVGVFAALDLVLFYVFWEAMLIPMYLLIAVWGGPERRYASIKFFLYTLAGSTLLLVAVVALRIAGGTFAIPELMQKGYSFDFQYWVFLAMAIAFAIKVPMFPFHTWLPAAHVQAPTAGSVLLASVLLKMGTYGFLRFCLPITPAGAEHFAGLMIIISLASIIYGGAVALGQSDIKKIIAYSSVGHMGFVTLGIFVFNLRGAEGALFQMLNHGITTGALFMMVGAAYERSHSREISDNLGLGKYLPAFMGLWGLFAFSSFGFPGTNSFVGEFLVFLGAFQRQAWVGFAAVPGALLAAAYMLRLTQRMAWGEPSSVSGWPDLNFREWAYLLPAAFFVLYIGLMPGVFYKVMDASLQNMLSLMQRPVAHYDAPPAPQKSGGLLQAAGLAGREGGR